MVVFCCTSLEVQKVNRSFQSSWCHYNNTQDILFQLLYKAVKEGQVHILTIAQI